MDPPFEKVLDDLVTLFHVLARVTSVSGTPSSATYVDPLSPTCRTVHRAGAWQLADPVQRLCREPLGRHAEAALGEARGPRAWPALGRAVSELLLSSRREAGDDMLLKLAGSGQTSFK